MNIDVCWRKWSQRRYFSAKGGEAQATTANLNMISPTEFGIWGSHSESLALVFWRCFFRFLDEHFHGTLNIQCVCGACKIISLKQTKEAHLKIGHPLPQFRKAESSSKKNMVPFPFNFLVGFFNLNLFGELSRITFQGLVHSLLDFREGMFFYLKSWHPKWVKHNHLH